MDAVLSLGLGVTLKVYDDILDLHLKSPEVVNEILKSFMIFCFTLLAAKDFMFSLTVFIIILTSSSVGGVDDPFWIAFGCIALCMTIMTLQKPAHFTVSLYYITLFILTLLLESKYFPEETSTRKTQSRIVMCLIAIVALYLPILDIPYIKKLSIFVVGYFGTSIVLTSCYPYLKKWVSSWRKPAALEKQDTEEKQQESHDVQGQSELQPIEDNIEIKDEAERDSEV